MGPQAADSLMIPFPDFEVHWDQIIDAPVLDRDSVAAMDTLWFELSAIGLHGNISSTTFEVDPVSDLRIHVWERFRWNIFYNEYGCGACWREQGVPGAWSEWLQLERRGNIYTTLDVYQEEPYTPVIPEEDYAMANAWAERQSTYYVVFDGPNVVEFRIVGESSGGTSVEKYVMFLIEPGD
jgi:hypothetical protein